MGVVIEDLWDHEGCAARRLPDGTLTSTSIRDFDAYVGACGCGWRANLNYPPTEAGEQAALDHWHLGHATPLLERPTQQRRAELAQALRALGGIADFRQPSQPAPDRPGRRPGSGAGRRASTGPGAAEAGAGGQR